MAAAVERPAYELGASDMIAKVQSDLEIVVIGCEVDSGQWY